MSLIKTTEDNKYFGKKWKIEANGGFAMALFLAAVVYLVYFIYLNFSAIANVIAFKTGIHPLVGIFLFLVVTAVIKKISNVGQYLSQGIWLAMGAAGMYWVVQYSAWDTYEKVALIFCHFVVYINLIMNALSSEE